MLFAKIVRLFESGNVCVSGLRGTGKDVLMGNVIARRNKPYISNLDYTNSKNYQKLDFDKLDMGKNTHKNLIRNDIKYYEFPYIKESDIYLSDAGIYFPSQYCNELNKQYPYLPTYFALSRQVSHNSFHINVQSLNRCWDKIREQSDIYILCRWCWVPFGKIILKLKEKKQWQWLDKIPLLVIQRITMYDKYQSAVDRVKPCRITVPLFASRENVLNAKMHLDTFANTYGDVKNHLLIYWHRSEHDTYYFEKLFKEGKKDGQE